MWQHFLSCYPDVHLDLLVGSEPSIDIVASCLDAGLAVRERVPVEMTAIRASAPMRADRKSTRLNSSHSQISYAVFCLQKKTEEEGPFHATQAAASAATDAGGVRPDMGGATHDVRPILHTVGGAAKLSVSNAWACFGTP